MTLRRTDVLCFLLATAGTFALFFFSRQLFHYAVPWGLEIRPYLLALFTIGALCRLAFRASPKLIYGGVALGEWLGRLWPHFDLTHFCGTCEASFILLLAMVGALGAWVASGLR